MSTTLITYEEVTELLRDYPENNLLLNGQEYTPAFVALSVDLAISEWNMIVPMSADTKSTFPMYGKAVLMHGVMWKIFSGQSALYARNQLTYSDGGLTIPVEERWDMYIKMAEMYRDTFFSTAKAMKLQINLQSGWGEIQSDQAAFPLF